MEKIKGPFEPGKLQQWTAAIVVNLPALSYGMIVGWPSPIVPQLQQEETPIGGPPLTDDEVSWLMAILCLSGLFVTPLLGPLSEKCGRKITGYLVVLPLGISWLLKISAYNSSYLLVARLFSGAGGAGALFLGPLYISEITSKNLRGSLGSLTIFSVNLGILLTFIFAALLDYHLFNILSFLVPVIFLGAFAFLPETPVYLIRKDRLNDATRSLIWFRGGNKFVAERELVPLQDEVRETVSNSASFFQLFTDRATRKGIIISVGLMAGQQLCGIFGVVSYSATIFHMAGSSLSPNMASIIIGVIQMVGSYLSIILMERLGRRILLLISTLGSGICLCTIAMHCYLQNLGYDLSVFGWIPVTSLSIFMITYCLGIGPIPFVITSEIFKREISSLAMSFSLFFLWLLAFVVIKLFGDLMNVLGVHGCLFVFAGFCAATFFFTLFLIPETKGRTLESIIAELGGTVNINENKNSSCTHDSNNHLDKESTAINQV